MALSARMLADEGWRDVMIRNVSSRGMMLRCIAPPVRNTFVEIRLQKARVIGRVVWSSDAACGINTQDTIELSDLLSQSPAKPRNNNVERRAQPRGTSGQPVQMRVLPTEEASRIFARIFDWTVVATAVAIGAIALADMVGTVLRKPIEMSQAALSSSSNGENRALVKS